MKQFGNTLQIALAITIIVYLLVAVVYFTRSLLLELPVGPLLALIGFYLTYNVSISYYLILTTGEEKLGDNFSTSDPELPPLAETGLLNGFPNCRKCGCSGVILK